MNKFRSLLLILVYTVGMLSIMASGETKNEQPSETPPISPPSTTQSSCSYSWQIPTSQNAPNLLFYEKQNPLKSGFITNGAVPNFHTSVPNIN